MKSTGQTTPELQMKAEQFINLGYQRLLTFETPDGGFSLFGQPPADVFLTAYGLMEMYDMSKVYPVDEGVIERKAIWLLEHQNADGSWTPSHPMESWRNLPSTDLPATAYVTWALGEAGYADAEQVHKAVTYIKEMAPQAKEAYVLALVGNALATTAPDDPITRQVLDRLAEMAVIEGESAYWEGGVSSFMGATGDVVSIETTALVAYAFIKADVHPDLVNKALTYLVRNKDSFGTWQTTQATILSLKALLASVSGGEAADATVDGQTDLGGKIPTNMSGGLIGKGHPIGATGASQVYMIVQQMRGAAPKGNQVDPVPEIGMTDTLGGDFGTLCHIILGRTRR